MKILYGFENLESFEFGQEYYPLNDTICEFESEKASMEDFEDLIIGFSNIFGFDPDKADIEVHIANLEDDGNMELFGEGVSKEIEFKIDDLYIKVCGEEVVNVIEDGKNYCSPFAAQKDQYSERRKIHKATLEYQLFMIRTYGNEYKDYLLEALKANDFENYAKYEIKMLQNERPKTSGFGV